MWPPPDPPAAGPDSSEHHPAPVVRPSWSTRLRLTYPDVAMIAAGVVTIVMLSAGLDGSQFKLIALGWTVLWVWRLVVRGWRVWGPLAAVATVVVALAGDVHVAERLARPCTTDIAVGMLEEVPLVSIDSALRADSGRLDRSGQPVVRNPGRCGLLTWRHAAVIDVNEWRRGRAVGDGAQLPIVPAVVLYAAGPDQIAFLHFVRSGYAYSPEVAPDSCVDLVGSSAANNGYVECRATPRGGGWYWFVAESAND